MNPQAVESAIQTAAQSAPTTFSPGVAGSQMELARSVSNAVPSTPASTFGDTLMQPFQRPGEFISQLAKPGSFLPIYVGETSRMQSELADQGRGSMRDYQEQQDAERRKTLAQMSNVFNQVRSAYPNIGYARGGQVEGYFDGGDIENQIRNALNQGGYNAMPDAENVQLALRGAEYVPPPAASYAALDVGGEGYLPGISGEFQYFREPTPPPPAAVDPGSMPGGGDIVGGGYFDPNFDFEGFLNQRGGYRNYMDLFGGGAGMPPTQEGQVDFISPSMERDVFAGGTPNFDERTGTYIPGGMPGMDFGNLEEFLSQYSPDAAQPAPTSPGTPTPFPQSMETPLDFLSEFEPGFNPDMMGGMSPALPPTVQPEPTRPPVNPLSARRAEGFEDLPSNQPTLDLLRETFDRMSTQPPPPQMPAPQIPPGMGRIEDSFVARPLPEPVPPGFNDNFAELIAPPQMGPPPVTPPPQMAQPPVPFMPSPQMPQRDQPFELPAAPPGMLGPLPSGGIADLAEQRQRIMPMPPRAEVLPQFGEEELLDDEELLAEMRRRRRPLDRGGFAEGGMTPMEGDMNPMQSDMAPQDELVMMTVAAIRGEIENADEIISAFVDQYGSEAFMQLREQVLQDIVPNAQTEGMVEGMGGGQDDMVEGMIGSQRPVAVSPGEYIIPADAVALAGGGYSGDGAKFFDGLVDDIRQRTMGTTEQVRPYQGRGM